MKFYPKAILIGLAVDLGLSFTCGLVEIIFLAGPVAIHTHATSVYVWAMVVGLMGCVIGGYATSYFSPRSKIYNAFLFGLIEVFLGLISILLMPQETTPLWFSISAFALTIPAGLLGSYVEQRLN